MSEATRARLEGLVVNEQRARAAVDVARAELVDALREARRQGGSTRELADVVGISHQLVFHLTSKHYRDYRDC